MSNLHITFQFKITFYTHTMYEYLVHKNNILNIGKYLISTGQKSQNNLHVQIK